MNRNKWVGAMAPSLLGVFIAAEAAAIVGRPLTPMSLAGTAEVAAIVGRPLTPMSYAGVARRTVRRSYYY